MLQKYAIQIGFTMTHTVAFLLVFSAITGDSLHGRPFGAKFREWFCDSSTGTRLYNLEKNAKQCFDHFTKHVSQHFVYFRIFISCARLTDWRHLAIK